MKTMIYVLMMISAATGIYAQGPNEANYDESKVPRYSLPDVLKTSKNARVNNKSSWEKVRRPEILTMFENNIYGQMPKTYQGLTYSVTHEDATAMNGRATLKQVAIQVTNNNKSIVIDLVLFTPNQAAKPVPAFVLINNRGWDNTDPTRATKSEFWPAEMLI